jgi:energy-coupling factor transporter ATP-binding protein EcfA2
MEAQPSEGMVIVELRGENFKRLKTVRIRPTGEPLVVIGGENGAGKSSVLDLIWATLGGKDACPDQPIRKGAKSGWSEVEFGGFVARRTYTPSGGEVALTAKDTGAKFPKPQAALDALVGPISFDPLVFAREEGRRLAMLQSILGIDLEALAKQRTELYAQRREVNRRADEAAKLAAAYRRQVPDGTPNKPVSVTELVDQLQDLEQENRAIVAESNRRDQMANRERDIRLRIGTLQGQLEAEELSLLALRLEVGKLEPLPDPMDAEPLRAQIKAVEPINAAVARAKQAAEQERVSDKQRAEAEALTEQMAALDAQRVDAIAAAHLPVEGLDLDGETVMFQGVPFSQASSAEQLRVSVALAIAANPKLRIMLIRDGSLLDAKNLAMIAEMAKAAEVQPWIERVGVGAETTIVMQDGEVRE